MVATSDGDADHRSRMADLETSGASSAETDHWHRWLSGGDWAALPRRRILRRLPSPPRCKLCAAPFQGWGSAASWLVGRRRPEDGLVCTHCRRLLRKYRGGAEIDVSVLFAELRGSIGANTGARAAGLIGLAKQFHLMAARVIDDHGGLIDQFFPSGIMALFLPRIAGDAHAERAIAAARDLFAAAKVEALGEAGIHLGAGLNSGPAFVGAIGDGDRVDFTARGDTIGIAVKLGAAATAGEALISRETWRRHGGPYAKSRLRTVPIPGALQPVEAVIIRGDLEATI